MDTFGSKLKAAREASGVSLRQIATETKIAVVALEALERNDLTKLPGGIFSRAFIRAYSVEVGLDPEETVREFLEEQARADRERSQHVRVPDVSDDDRRFVERQQHAARVLRIVAAVVLVGGAVLLVWLGQRWMEPAPPAVTPTDAVDTTPQAAPVDIDLPQSLQPTVQAAGAVPTDLEIAFELTGDCWVQVAVDGRISVNRLMRAGERMTLPRGRVVSIDVGNAGVFGWRINGQTARPLGGAGTHKVVQVTPETLAEFVR